MIELCINILQNFDENDNVITNEFADVITDTEKQNNLNHFL